MSFRISLVKILSIGTSIFYFFDFSILAPFTLGKGPIKVLPKGQCCHKQRSFVAGTEFQLEMQCVILLQLPFVW